MMDIVMLVAGAGVGAMLRDLFVLHRGDKSKKRQQLESKTPYDYALANARADNNRYRDELFTIKALKRTEADTERIRNEIDTMLSDDGEESPEGVYEPNIGMPIQDNGDGTFSPITWDTRISMGEMADNISKAVSRMYGANVREDDSEDEQSTEDDVERSLTKAVRDSFKNNDGIRVFWEDSPGRTCAHYGSVDEIKSADGKVIYFGIKGTYISAIDVTKITKGDVINGETLYRKGSR